MRWISMVAAVTFCLAGALPAFAQNTTEAPAAAEKDDGSGPAASTEDVEQPVSSEPAQQSAVRAPSSQYFTLEVCNSTRRKAFVAVSSRNDPSAREWYVTGWWGVQPGDCRNLGRFPRSAIYLHAEASGGGRWTGRDINICVEKQKFKRIAVSGYKCPRPQLRGFYKKTITADKFTWRLTPG